MRAEFERLCTARTAELAARGGGLAERLAALDARIDARERRAAELGEARAACAEACTELAAIVESLGDAWTHAIAGLFSTGWAANYQASLGTRTTLNDAYGHVVRAGAARFDGDLVGDDEA